MKKTLLFLLFLPASQFLSAQPSVSGSDAAPTHIGHFIFRIPEGWKTSQQGNLFSMIAADTGPDELLSYLLLDPVTADDFPKIADATLSQVAAALQGEAVRQVPGAYPLYFQLYTGRCLKGWDYSWGNGKIRIPVTNTNNPYQTHIEFTVGVFLAKLNGRVERVCYLSKDYRCGIYGTTTSYKWSYDKIIDDFFFELRFDDWPEEAVKPGKLTSTGISGVWSGVAYIQGQYRPGFFVLYDNGQAYYNSDWPKFGLFNLNTIAAAASDPPHWGTYTFQGSSGVMTISWQTIPFSLVGNKISASMNGSTREFEKMPVADDIRLNGDWSEYNGSVSIAFTADGQFEDKGVLRGLVHKPTTCNEALPEKGGGRYEIRNHSILFHYSGGPTTQMAISELGLQQGISAPEQLILGFKNDVLKKK